MNRNGLQRPVRTSRHPDGDGNRCIAFGHIENQSHDARQLAERAGHVRRADVAAADLANVRAGHQLDDEEAEWNRSEEIRDDEQAGDEHGGILAFRGEALDGCTQRRWIQRRISIEIFRHLLEQRQEHLTIDQTIADHRINIGKILPVSALEFRQCL